MNVDFKIVSKAFATRLKHILPNLINTEQTAYVKDRFIGESGRLISDIIEISELLKVKGFIATMDIEKAFDTLDHDFLISVLNKFGFGKNFINWIKIFTNNQESCVINGG